MRSHVVKWKEINRYLRRKGIGAFATSSAQPSSPPPVTAYTPCQSPVIPEASGLDTPDPVGPADPLRDDVEYEVPREEIGPLLPFIAPLTIYLLPWQMPRNWNSFRKHWSSMGDSLIIFLKSPTRGGLGHQIATCLWTSWNRKNLKILPAECEEEETSYWKASY